MVRQMMILALGGLLLTGCGGNDGGADAESRKAANSEPTVSYFVKEDSDAINAAAAPLNKAYATAIDTARIGVCNESDSFGPYRACVRKLLDPYADAIPRYAAELEKVGAKEGLSEKCLAEVAATVRQAGAQEARVRKLIADFDSDAAGVTESAANRYQKVVDGTFNSILESFKPLTQACYSPDDLESINASPTASPTPGPTPSPGS